jgi:tetratricopeptide (TPR) repeat protein
MLKFFYLRAVSVKTKTADNKNEIEAIVSKLLSYKKNCLHTFSAQSIRLHIMATYYSDKGIAVKANSIMREHINLYHNYPKIKKEYYFNFLNINYQLADLLITTKKFSEAEKHLEALEQNKNDNKGYESLFFTLHYSALLKLYTETKEFAQVLKLEKYIEREKQNINSNIPDEAQNHFDYCFAISHVYLNNYDKAINYLQNIINRKNNHSHFVAAKTMLFICHYELKNDSILLHLAEGALRAMNTTFKSNLPSEAILLDLFIKNNKTNNSQQFIQVAKKYLHKKENKSKKVLEPFNVLEWIENK